MGCMGIAVPGIATTCATGRTGAAWCTLLYQGQQVQNRQQSAMPQQRNTRSPTTIPPTIAPHSQQPSLQSVSDEQQTEVDQHPDSVPPALHSAFLLHPPHEPLHTALQDRPTSEADALRLVSDPHETGHCEFQFAEVYVVPLRLRVHALDVVKQVPTEFVVVDPHQ